MYQFGKRLPHMEHSIFKSISISIGGYNAGYRCTKCDTAKVIDTTGRCQGIYQYKRLDTEAFCKYLFAICAENNLDTSSLTDISEDLTHCKLDKPIYHEILNNCKLDSWPLNKHYCDPTCDDDCSGIIDDLYEAIIYHSDVDMIINVEEPCDSYSFVYKDACSGIEIDRYSGDWLNVWQTLQVTTNRPTPTLQNSNTLTLQNSNIPTLQRPSNQARQLRSTRSIQSHNWNNRNNRHNGR